MWLAGTIMTVRKPIAIVGKKLVENVTRNHELYMSWWRT